MSPQQISEMVAQIKNAEARLAQQVNRRKPENAHLRTLWDAKQRAAKAGDWQAYANIDATMKLYRQRPESAASQSSTPPEVTSSSSGPQVKASSGGVNKFMQKAIVHKLSSHPLTPEAI